MSISSNLNMPQIPISGASAWYGRDLISSADWISPFSKSEKLEIELEHYKRLVNNLQSEVSYYKNLFKPNNIENIVRPKACAYN